MAAYKNYVPSRFVRNISESDVCRKNQSTSQKDILISSGLAFSYEGGLPVVKEDYLKSISAEAYEKAKAIFDGMALDFHPENIRDKDKRWSKRNDTLGMTEESKAMWLKMKGGELEADELRQIIITAKGYGFFSVWMMVFGAEEKIKRALIGAFEGTATNCFDSQGNAIRRSNGL